MQEQYKALITAAAGARELSYAPYSNFCVGAALLARDGRIFTGCNVENAAYSPTNCAERTAVFKAVSEGVREFAAIAVVGGKRGEISPLCAPCGVCRQVLAEFDPKLEMEVYLVNSEGEILELTMKDLLPYSFDSSYLG